MQAYTELVAPTAVSHAISLPFVSATANNLIVARTNRLQLFSLKNVAAVDSSRSTATSKNDILDSTSISTTTAQTKLVLLAEYGLAGSVSALARVRLARTRSNGYALLVALRDAKLSLVEWDPDRYCLSTISVHYYEKHGSLQSPLEPDLAESPIVLTVDPLSRCALFKFGARRLAILPFRQIGDDVTLDEISVEDGKASDDTALTTASVILPLNALDAGLTHPIHLAFLHEYREPTFGVLASAQSLSSALLPERRDILSYKVLNLDLEQKASTTLLSVNKLPNDLCQILPLLRVIGGALLIGSNQLIHIDQAGRANGVAVNELAKVCTSFALADQSDLGLRLEGCKIQQIGTENPELLLVPSDGSMFLVAFTLDGRSVSGISIRAADHFGQSLPGSASVLVAFPRGRLIFVGSEEADSNLIGWSRVMSEFETSSGVKEEDALALDEDDDDLYGDNNLDEVIADALPSTVDRRDYHWRVHDFLPNIAPLADLTFRIRSRDEDGARQHHELVGLSGGSKSSDLLSLNEYICPEITRDLEMQDVQNVWALSVRQSDGVDATKYHTHMFVNIDNGEDDPVTQVWSVDGAELKLLEGTDFEPQAGNAISVGTIGNGSKIVQVLPTEVRVYDSDLSLAQIFPVSEDLSEETTQVAIPVRSVSFLDPYLLLLKSDGCAVLLHLDDNGDLDEVTSGERFRQQEWSAGCLYDDANDELQLDFSEEEEEELSNVLVFLISRQGGLYIYRAPALKSPVFEAQGLGFVPPYLTEDFFVPRSTSNEAFVDVIVMELGDQMTRSPHIIVGILDAQGHADGQLRTAEDNIHLYQPYQAPSGNGTTRLKFFKRSTNYLPPGTTGDSRDAEDRLLRAPMRALPEIGGFSGVWVPGAPSYLVLQSSSSRPHIMPLDYGEIKDLCPLDTEHCTAGFAFVTEMESLLFGRLPAKTDYQTGLALRKDKLNMGVDIFAFHEQSEIFALSATSSQPYRLSEADMNQGQNWHFEDEDASPGLLPAISTSTLHLYDPGLGTIIHTQGLEPGETVLCMTSASLCISELHRERKELICVGTTFIKGEDVPNMGRILLFEVIPVVPDPEMPMRRWGLKLIAKDEVRGAVTAVSSIGTQGFLMHTQGQKTLVKGLKEDRSFLPVAFMDMECHVTTAVELPPSGLCLMTDILKGAWFTGYTEDPYQLRFMSKSPYPFEAMAGGFLPDGSRLYVCVADSNGNIHVLQYEPEDPTTLAGHNLLAFMPFHTPHFASHMKAFPAGHPRAHTLLVASGNGSLAILKPLPESTHRTLTYLQNHLANTLPQPLGLNPRAFRTPTGKVGHLAEQYSHRAGTNTRSVIDVDVIRRWEEMGSWKRWGGEEKEEVRRCVAKAAGRRTWGYACRDEWGEILD